jgi:hypothetical protein
MPIALKPRQKVQRIERTDNVSGSVVNHVELFNRECDQVKRKWHRSWVSLSPLSTNMLAAL